MSHWTIFSNHGHVLFCIARDPEARLRDVAADVGLTERAVQKIVRDLQACGMISVSKHGRRNHYRIDNSKSLRHDLESHCTLGALIDLIDRKTVTKADPATPVKPEAEPDAEPEEEPVSLVTVAEIPPIQSPFLKKPAKAAKSDGKPVIERQQGSLF